MISLYRYDIDRVIIKPQLFILLYHGNSQMIRKLSEYELHDLVLSLQLHDNCGNAITTKQPPLIVATISRQEQAGFASGLQNCDYSPVTFRNVKSKKYRVILKVRRF